MATSELQFLINLLLNHKLPKETKKLVADRVGEVEEALRVPGRPAPMMIHPGVPNLQQAPSTQRLLEAQVQAPALLPVIPRMAGGEINNGDGTKGKRKW